MSGYLIVPYCKRVKAMLPLRIPTKRQLQFATQLRRAMPIKVLPLKTIEEMLNK